MTEEQIGWCLIAFIAWSTFLVWMTWHSAYLLGYERGSVSGYSNAVKLMDKNCPIKRDT